MKAQLLFSLTLLIGFTFTACKKQEDDLKNDKFTDCPSGISCSYLYVDYADIEGTRIVPGNFRVFRAEFKSTYSTAHYYFKVDRRNTQFYMPSSQIRNSVKYTFACPACSWIQTGPAAGYIKGSKITNSKWLIDAALIMTSDNVPGYRDTVYLKQYFNLSANSEIDVK